MPVAGSASVHVLGVSGLPEVAPGDDLADIAWAAVRRAALPIDRGDVVVFTQKIVSKAEGRLVALDTVTPSAIARSWAEAWQKDPRVIELVLRESVRIVRMERGVLITETKHGFICANAGVDASNVRPGWATLLPADPDLSARHLCERLRARSQVLVGVIISDTFGRPWREGQTNVAIGVAGLPAIADYRGGVDTQGQPLRATAIAVADELAGAAELVMGKTLGVPLAVVKGTGLGDSDLGGWRGRDLIRKREEDLFR